jgi:hypothetical protein
MLIWLAAAALSAFAGAILLPWVFPAAPAAHAHLVLAAGIMPLILGAMTHFVPVLTRSTGAPLPVRSFPFLALGAGVLAFLSFAFPAALPGRYDAAAGLGLLAAGAMALWIAARGNTSLGAPHPCLHWYLAAIGCLIAALLAVAAMPLWPEQRLFLKRLHLHLNTLGFVGLTAIGTLQVLLPTAAGRPDPQAAGRLRSDLWPALAGALLTAVGAAWENWLLWPGLALWGIALSRLALAWGKGYRFAIASIHGAAPSLAAAAAGFGGALLLGALHAGGGAGTTHTAHAYILGFLFPLVTGALSQLLPVWVRPGPQTAWHGEIRQTLSRWGGLRGVLFLAGGMAVGLGGKWGVFLSAGGLALFLAQLGRAFLDKKILSS